MELYIVGGKVRDYLLGRHSKDTDFVVVGSTPEKMLEMGYQQVGADFPVFLHPETGDEYALARTERKSGKGYHGFETDHSDTVTLEDDLKRRDLTINAMAIPAFSSNFKVIDPFGGEKDIDNKVLRHVSEAFADDPVRVLRLARFHARFGPEWSVHSDTLHFCTQMVDAGELQHLTAERVWAELVKALSEPYPHLFFETLAICGAMDVVFPEMKSVTLVGLWTDFTSLKKIPSPEFAYSILCVQLSPEEQFKLETRLPVPNEFVEYKDVALHVMGSATDPVGELYRMDIFRHADRWERIVADFIAAGQTDVVAELDYAFRLVKDIGFKDLSKSQQALLKGPAIGQAIRKLREERYEYDQAL